jgi:hypothetical protein
MKYEGIPSTCQTDIPIIDWSINKTLDAGTSSIDLDIYAQITRYLWAGIDFYGPAFVFTALCDLGKSGSDGVDEFGTNPKYNGDNGYLCSEFVSWYYHEGGLVIDGSDFRDIEKTQTMHTIFKNAGLLYRYNKIREAFVHIVTGDVYEPRAGDFLERRYDGQAEHAMMVLRWDDTTKEITVINGPWPVTLRTINVQTDSKNYCVGRVEDL